ncbi:MAG: N-formimino-L-glutamate deiminase [Rhodospirillales bacterium]|nr:N-formimino-L-glutamate deiminase [Rhodospirillales bacterium]
MQQTLTALHFGTALLPDGWARNVRLTLAYGRIALVERDVAAVTGDQRAGIALPGMPNLHSHAFQRGMAGLTERRGKDHDSFWTWRTLMYRFVERITPDDLEAIAAQAYVEMLEAGFTRVGEFHYLHHGAGGQAYADIAEMGTRIAAAAAQAGIGLTLLPVFYAHGGFGGLPPGAMQSRFLNDLDSYAELIAASRGAAAGLDGAVVGIAPHSLRAITPDELAAILPLAPASPIHIHVAEQLKEVADCKDWTGARPVEWLLDHNPVDPRWCLVHATHMTEAETVRLAASGAVAGLCPITEANLGDGLFPAPSFRDAGGAFGIGTDSNVLISVAEELRLLEYGQRLQGRVRNIMAAGPDQSTGRALFDMALLSGARALGAESGLKVGAPADIVSLKSDHPVLVARGGDEILDSFIFAGGYGLISDVWRGGRKLVSDGMHRDRAVIAAHYGRTLERLLAL